MKNLSKKPSYYSLTNHAKHHGMTPVTAPFRPRKERYDERFPFTRRAQLLSILMKPLLRVKVTQALFSPLLVIQDQSKAQVKYQFTASLGTHHLWP